MRWMGLAALAALAIALAAGQASAQEQPEPPPPQEVEAFDTPNDSGKSIMITWRVWPGETGETLYTVLMAKESQGPYTAVANVKGKTSFKIDKPKYFGFSEKGKLYHYAKIDLPEEKPEKPGDKPKPVNGVILYFKVKVSHGGAEAESKVVSAASYDNFFDSAKWNNFLLVLIFGGVVMWFIQYAKKNPNLFIRRISGLDAVDEAIGRATEMGKPIFYTTGLKPMSELPTIASINILSRTARIVAEHDTTLKVPCYDPIVMTVAQEVVKDAYTKVGRPDAYNEDNVFFITQDQFSYVAAVDGMMMRERPATNFFLGYFYAESLLLAEAGASIGAIQIAGTDALAQLPFFVTTCDYTLIGEELYAASAYLSREPVLLGSLRGQDVGKAFLMIVLLVGTVLTLVGVPILRQLLTPF